MPVYKKQFQLAGLALEIQSDLPIGDDTFHPKLKPFEFMFPGKADIIIRYHFVDDGNVIDLAGYKLSYAPPPLAIYQKKESLVYLWIRENTEISEAFRVLVTDKTHRLIDVYNPPNGKKQYMNGNLESLSMLSSDQICLGGYLAYHHGCILHSAGIILNQKGYLFVGHSDAGKSTISNIMSREAEILCDDRNVVRLIDDTFHVYGTWSHGDIPQISPNGAPLKAIFFLEQAEVNQIVPLQNQREIFHRLMACLIKPFVTPDWWHQTLDLLLLLSQRVPCRTLKFDKSGAVLYTIKQFSDSESVHDY